MCAIGMLVFLYWDYDFLELYKAPNARAGTLDSRVASYYALNLAILIIVLIVLCIVTRVNGRRRQAARNAAGAYDLSESYQLQENEVFLQIFMPFAFVCASYLAVYHAMMLSLRMFGVPDLVVKVSASETIYLFSLLSTSFGMLAYMRMLRKLATKTSVIAVQPSEQGNVYFDHFRRLMGTDVQSRPQSRASVAETVATQGVDDLAGRNRSVHAWWADLASLITVRYYVVGPA
ncbi:hypothetical protein AAVH_36952 [Aphelenchoides avenae]|nr:hypothetical protein AAVH_36952 [Aphelenchus avenae]